MRQVYLSFLGINDYSHCTYTYKSEAVKNIRFVQEATLKLFARDWQPADRVYILTTEDAFTSNWKDKGQPKRVAEGKPCEGLQRRIEQLKLQAAVQCVIIPKGKSETEIWDIFKTIYDLLELKDAVIFDITHAFRSIPMLAVVVLNYARVLKQIRISGIYYGAFEVLGTKVKNLPVEDREAPIFDLTPFATLLHWSEGIDSFLKSGNAALLKEMTTQELNPVMRDNRDLRDAGNTLKRLARTLDDFALAMSTCRGRDITAVTQKLQQILNQSMDIGLIPAFEPLLEQLQPRVARFGDDDIQNGIEAARWCLEHQLIQQGYTILQETLVSHVLKLAGQDPVDMEFRQIVTSATIIIREQLPMEQWREAAARHVKIASQIVEIVKGNGIHKLLDNLQQERNDLNHAGQNASPTRPATFFKKLNEHIHTFETFFKAASRK